MANLDGAFLTTPLSHPGYQILISVLCKQKSLTFLAAVINVSILVCFSHCYNLCRTYNNKSVVIMDSYIQFSFNATQQVSWPYAYDGGMMMPLVDDLAASGAGIDTSSGIILTC